MNSFQKLIQEICEEENIKFFCLSKDWVIMLEKDGKTRFISGYKFDLNDHGIGAIFDDKYATFEVLKRKGIPVIEHKIVFQPTNQNDYAKVSNSYKNVEEFFFQNNQNIVIKGNTGTCGNEVYHIQKQEAIIDCLNTLFSSSFSISLCPFYNIKNEYRLILLHNTCLFMYGKKKCMVVGNGKSSLRELLMEFNPYYFSGKLSAEKFDSVLKKGEVYEYSWQHNLSKGAIPFLIEDECLKNELLTFVKKITDSLDLGFCSVDIVETESHEFLVMEINSGVMMKHCMEIFPNGRAIAKEIYSKAVLSMFY